MAFDVETQVMKLNLLQKRTFHEPNNPYGKLMFVMSSIPVLQNEDEEEKAKALVGDLQLDSDKPFMFQVMQNIVLPVCAYSIPGTDVKAVVIQLPEDADME